MPEKPESPQEDSNLRFGRLALERGFITADELRTALAEQARRVAGRQSIASLADILVEKGYLREEQRSALVLAQQQTAGAAGRSSETPSHAPLGKYEILRELGRGGMGVVYEAMDTQLRRKVALKMLLPAAPSHDPQESQMEEERFLREARLSANLAKHPNIVSVYEAGVIDGRRYLAMEFIDGLPMAKWRKSGSITIRQQIKLLRDVAVAVHHAHRQNVIHRDLKPDNILIDALGQCHVTDFGLAKSVGQNVRISLTTSGMIVGTPAYMSPEQALGEKQLDHRTDIYALGVMLYETLTGRLPFTGETAIEILMKASKNPVPLPSAMAKPGINPTLDKAIENICLKALAKNPKERYATAEALANDLTRWLKGEEVRVAAPTRRRVAAKAEKPNHLWVYVGGAAVAVVALVLFLGQSSSPPEPGPSEVRAPRREDSDAKRREIERLLEDAKSRQMEGKLPEALAIYDQVLRKDHGNAEATAGKDAIRAKELERELAKADALMKEGKYREAFRAYAIISAKDPSSRRASSGMEDAEKRMEEAIKKAKDEETLAKTEAERQAAEQRRREVEEANRRAQEQARQEQAQLQSAKVRDASIRTLSGHDSPVWAVSFSPDGKTLASGSVDLSIRLWDVAKGSQIAKLSEGSGVFGLSFTRDGKLLASGNVDTTIKIWDPAGGKEPRVLRGHEKAVNRVAWSPDGLLLASVAPDGMTRLWDAAKGTLLHKFESAKDQTCPTPLFLSKGKVLVYGSDASSIRFVDVKSGGPVRAPLRHEGLSALAANPEGTMIASAGWNRRISLWDAASGALLRTCEGHTDGIWSVAFSPDGRTLASGSADRTIRLWDVETGKPVDTLVGQNQSVQCIAYHPDGRLLASAGGDGTVKLWSVEGSAGEEAWKKSIDLLALVDPRRDTIRGTWRKEGGKLLSDPTNNGCLRLPYEAPEEYDFRVVFTRRNGRCATAQFFVHQGRHGIWDLNKGGLGFCDVGGLGPGANATHADFPIQDDTRYVSMIQVRRGGVRGWIDRQKHSQWVPEMGALSTPGDWGVDVPGVLGIGNCETSTTFEAIQVLEVTGKGRLRTGAPAKGAVVEVTTSGLVAFWKLNESAGTTAADSSGSRLNGKVAGGAQWVKGKSGGLRLDGVRDVVDIPVAPVLEKLREGSYTVSAWFKPEELPAGTEVKVLVYPIVRSPWFALSYLEKRHFMMQHVAAGGVFATGMAPEGSSPAGVYSHAVGVVDKAGGETLIYVNGQSRGSGRFTPNTVAGSAPWPAGWNIGIATSGVEPGRSMGKGSIDSIRIYNRALIAAEVEALYKAELPAHEK